MSVKINNLSIKISSVREYFDVNNSMHGLMDPTDKDEGEPGEFSDEFVFAFTTLYFKYIYDRALNLKLDPKDTIFNILDEKDNPHNIRFFNSLNEIAMKEWLNGGAFGESQNVLERHLSNEEVEPIEILFEKRKRQLTNKITIALIKLHEVIVRLGNYGDFNEIKRIKDKIYITLSKWD